MIKSSFKHSRIKIIFPVDVKIIKQLSSFLASLLHETLGEAMRYWCVSPSACRMFYHWLSSLAPLLPWGLVCDQTTWGCNGSFSVVLLNWRNSLWAKKLQNCSDFVQQVLAHKIRVWFHVGTNGIFLWGSRGFFWCVFLTALRVVLQLGVAQMLLNLRRVLTTEGQRLLTAYSPYNRGHPTAFSRKEEPVPVGMSRPWRQSPGRSRCWAYGTLLKSCGCATGQPSSFTKLSLFS